MIPYDLDPSLHSGEPESDTLDDGFSPPHHGESVESMERPQALPVEPIDPALLAKSAF